MKNFRKMDRAFTLVELLVVIAIVAILAVILFPVFAQAKAQAEQIRCLSNLHQLCLGQLSYVTDHEDTLPGIGAGLGPGHAHSPNNRWGWVVKVANFDVRLGEYTFPADSPYAGETTQGEIWPYTKMKSLYSEMGSGAHWQNVPAGSDHLSYSMNSCFGRKSSSEFPQGPSTIILTEEQGQNGSVAVNDGAYLPMNSNDVPTDRHHGGGNVGFLDGHSKWYRQSELIYRRPTDHNRWYLFNPYREIDGPSTKQEVQRLNQIGICRYAIR